MEHRARMWQRDKAKLWKQAKSEAGEGNALYKPVEARDKYNELIAKEELTQNKINHEKE